MKIYILINFYALITIYSIVTFICGKCPSTQLLFPCKCADDNISCGGNENIDLSNVFQLVSQSLSDTDKHFKRFYFNNTIITEMVSSVFHDLTFESILIENALNLTKINSYAFTSTNCYLKDFRLQNTPYNVTENNNIFHLINQMVNIEYIDIRNTAITTIPSNAFTVLNKLRILYIHSNSQLKTLGNNSFQYLNYLDELAVDGNLVEQIPDNAFNIPNKSNQTMIIWLLGMPLTVNSFTSQTFANLRRPYEIRFGNEKFGLKYLDQSTFGTVLSNGNTINFWGNVRMECDCRMQWIYENRAQYEKLILNPLCTTDGKSLFSDAERFVNCTH